MAATEFLSPVQQVVERRSGAGFLMLSSSMQVLHWDRGASELCRQIISPPRGDAQSALPVCVTGLANEIVKLMEIRTEPKDWEQFQLRRLVKNGPDSILLTGIGLPRLGGVKDSRVLIILERIRLRHKFSIERAKEQFHLTDRETEVIEHLMKGWTNKEIANEIAISEQTVKEHIKHIMDKTQTSTRTGILVQIFQG
jgi:DNA-binding CsgD family transcriptional regulator